MPEPCRAITSPGTVRLKVWALPARSLARTTWVRAGSVLLPQKTSMLSPTAAFAGKGNTTTTPSTASAAVTPPASSEAALAVDAEERDVELGAAGGVMSITSVLLTTKEA